LLPGLHERGRRHRKKLIEAARLRARGQLSINSQADEDVGDELAEAFAALGLQCEDSITIDQDEFWLWPENEEVFWLWLGLQTQWTASMAGAVGLSYASVEAYLRMKDIPKKKRRQIFPLIQHMEQATLEEWASQR
jgi:hypothetical protein